MPKLECTRCGAIKEAPTLKEARETIDHGVGLVKGRPCPNDGTNLMLWDGVPAGSQEDISQKKLTQTSFKRTVRTDSTTSQKATAKSTKATKKKH